MLRSGKSGDKQGKKRAKMRKIRKNYRKRLTNTPCVCYDNTQLSGIFPIIVYQFLTGKHMNELSDLISGIKDGGKLVLEQGKEYHIFAEDCFTGIGDGAAKRAAVFLENKKDIVIDGSGSAIVLHGDITPLYFSKSRNIKVKNLTINFACDGCEGAKSGACHIENETATNEEGCPKGAGAYIENSENILLLNMRFKGFSGTAVFVKDTKNIKVKKTECVLSKDGNACEGIFRFENCEGKVLVEECAARGKAFRGDFLHIRGGKKCDLIARNNCTNENIGRGIYYACRGKAVVIGNTFSKTGGAALCAKDFRGEHGVFTVKKVVFENNVVDGCGNAYEDRYSVAYFPATASTNTTTPPVNGKAIGKLVLKNNHFFNPENEEHKIYISDLKGAILKNNSFDRPYKVSRENVKKIVDRKNISAKKCK